MTDKKGKKKEALHRGKNRVKIPLKKIGLSGFHQNLITRPSYRDPKDSRNFGNPGGDEGDYKVIFTISRPGFSLHPEGSFTFNPDLEGDSHLAITEPAIKEILRRNGDAINIASNSDVGNFNFLGFPNRKGFLGKIILSPINALNFEDAEKRAYRALTPSLSNISLFFDIPLHICQTEVCELRTNSKRLSVLLPFIEKPFTTELPKILSQSLRKYGGYYREALNSNSVFYNFLCFFKIIEGMRERRKELNSKKKSQCEKPQKYPRHKIPSTKSDKLKLLDSIFPISHNWDDMALDQVFPRESIDRNIFDIVDKELKNLRNKIAHAFLKPSKPTLSLDEAEDINLVQKWLPLTKCIARLVLKDEFPDAFLKPKNKEKKLHSS